MFSIIRRDQGFFDMFDKAAGMLARAADSYAELARDYSKREAGLTRIRQLEHDCDEVMHATLDKLDRTFITPFDREDIQSLMRLMDDVMDEIDAASKRLSLYQITEPTGWLIKLTEVLRQSCRLVGVAVGKLRHFKKPNGLHETLIELHRLENEGDDCNHAAVAELYNSGQDPILVMKWKEIYDLTERAIDCCEDVANTIQAIVIKNA